MLWLLRGDLTLIRMNMEFPQFFLEIMICIRNVNSSKVKTLSESCLTLPLPTTMQSEVALLLLKLTKKKID